MARFDEDTSAFPGAEHRRALLEELRSSFRLEWHGIHGVAHWSRVWSNGRRLAQLEGSPEIDLGVVELFAWLHDSCRLNDEHDPDHGPRAAELACELRGAFFELSDERFELLRQACRGHTRGLVQAHPTVMVCWDSDRLDLGRVGLRPDPERLCTGAAKRPEVIDWALARSLGGEPRADFGADFDGESEREQSSLSRAAVPDEAAYLCDSCGESIVIPIDASAGRRQEYVEDCPVCCNANVIRVDLGEDGQAWASAHGE